MELVDFIAQMTESTRAAMLRVTANLTQEEAAWRAGYGANPVGFLLWHVGRTQDRFYNQVITSGPQIWEKNGWYSKLKLPLRDTGNSYTPEQVESFLVPELKQLFAYMDEVQQSSLQIIRTLDPKRLQEVPVPERPDMTVLNFMRQHIAHENQHIGAMEYILGLARSHAHNPVQ